jgi:hypothetical protein
MYTLFKAKKSLNSSTNHINTTQNKITTHNLSRTIAARSDSFKKLVNCEKYKSASEMDNEKNHPSVTIYCDIVEDPDAGNNSDTTVGLSPPSQQPSPTTTAHCEESIKLSQYFSPKEKESTHIYKSIQAQPTQETTRARRKVGRC